MGALLPACCLTALPLAATLAGAQPSSPSEGESPLSYQENVSVIVTEIEVFVTDKKGNPVTGLKPKDFEIRVDGRKAELTNFYAVEDGEEVRAPEPTPKRERSRDEKKAPEPAPVDEPETVDDDRRLHLVVYVDNFNLRPTNRRWALSSVRNFVSQLSPDDRAMLVSYDRGFHIRQPFTDDPSRVVQAMYELDRLTAHAVTRDGERERALESISFARSRYSALSHAQSYAQFVELEMGFAQRALRELVRSLAGIRGRKALLYVSDGLPRVAAEDLFVAVDARFGAGAGRVHANRYDMARHYEQISSLANSNGVTMYTLDARGMEGNTSLSAAEGGRRFGDQGFLIDATRNINLQSPLMSMAGATGGRAIVNTNALDAALTGVTNDFRSYYSLGYRPISSQPGQYHTIEVKVKGRGLKVRHREGFRGKGPEARMLEGASAALNFGFEQNPLSVRLELEAPSRAEKKKQARLPLLIKIPIGRLTLLPTPGAHEGRVRVAFGLIDHDGGLVPVQEQEPLDIRIPDEAMERARGQYFTYTLDLVVRHGPHRVAVAVWDEVGGEMSFVSQPFQIEDEPPS